jgi:hypothetical protein
MSDKDKERFEFWLAEMDDALDRFIESLPAEIRMDMNFSENSLDAVEAWILRTFSGTEEMLSPSAKDSLDGAARYIGETFRNVLGGKWKIRLDDSSYAFHGLPQLTEFSPSSTPIAPHSLATASADRRTGQYLRTVLQNARRRIR